MAQSGFACFVHSAAADQESRDFLNGFLRRGQTDALQRTFRQRGQSFHAQRQMRAAPVIHDGVNFIHDQRAGRAQHLRPDSEVSSR